MRNYICSRCGAYLDASERCDCLEKETIAVAKWEGVTFQSEDGQLQFNIKKLEELKYV